MPVGRQEIHVPTSRILDILHNRRRISIETGLRLAKFFGPSERFFINLQIEIDIRNEIKEHSKELEEIHPLKDVLSV